MRHGAFFAAHRVPGGQGTVIVTQAVGWLVVALLAVAAALLLFALYHLRTAASEGEGVRVWGSPSPELLWIIVPLLVLALIFFISAHG